jgi:uncharacterized protein (TIGR03663 family)
MTRRQLLFPALILLTGVLVRLLFLDIKPPHFDEGINGWFCDQMRSKGFYAYDPTNYHGPLHFYVLFTFLELFGRNLWALRLPVVLVSSLTIFWLFLFRPFFGRMISLLAALGMAISPAFIFYNRYSIHETWLVFFLVVSFWGFLGVWTRGKPRYWWGLVLGLAGMILTKETFIIHVVCFLLAGVFLSILRRFGSESRSSKVQPDKIRPDKLSIAHLAGAIGVGVFLIIFFYSGNFRNPAGLAALVESFVPWTKTGIGAAGHGKPNYDLFPVVPPFLAQWPILKSVANINANWYWVKLLSQYEWFALFGLLFSFRFWAGGNAGLRLLAIYAFGALAVYSLIPYKTPWCIISIEWPFLFFGAAMLKWICERFGRLLAFGISIPLFAQSAWSASWLNFVNYDDAQEPYVYVQTVRDYRKLVDPLLEKAKQDPKLYSEMTGSIILSSYYPLPWVLGDFTSIGYIGQPDPFPSQSDADFIVIGSDKAEALERVLKDRYFVETFKLREGMDLSKVYFRYERFKDLFPNRAPEFDPGHRSTANTEGAKDASDGTDETDE